MKGIFITLEGGEGSGKTTTAKMIKEALEPKKHVVITREPGGVKIAEEIRNVIVDVNNTEMDARTEALLYAASRRQHLVEKVMPVLAQGGIVICDRFIYSSLVYQGIGRGLGIENVYNMNLFATEGVMPDLTLFFDIKPEEALKRINMDDEREVNRLDLESLSFHQSVYNGYKKVVSMYPDRIKTINAAQSVEEVLQQALKEIEKVLLNIKKY